jgi:hypothetical protein
VLGVVWIAIKGLGIWSRLGAWFSALATWAASNPWPALAVVLTAGNVVQSVIATDKTNLAAITAAQATAAQAAIAARNAAQAAYQTRATEADNAHTTLAANSADAADRYIADHHQPDCRVQPAPAGGPGSQPPAATQSGDPGVSGNVPAGAILVSPEDVRACTGAVDYAIAAHQWAATVNGP